MNDKHKKQLQAQALGMPVATAKSKLNKKILHSMLYQMGYGICSRCHTPILSPEDLAIEHLDADWISDSDKFWDLGNIRFSHVDCNRRSSMIEVILLNESGSRLSTYEHKGETYIAGKEGERYKIRLRNTTSKHIEVVVSVDGRDVISGEEGDYIKQKGYILSPYGSTEIAGFRQNLNEVAAFRFSKKEKSYSSKLGTPENVGIVGVAAFSEKQSTICWGWVNHHHHHYDWRWPKGYDYDYPYVIGTGGTTSPLRSHSISCCNSPEPASYQVENCARGGDLTVKGLGSPSIGTEYGETINSKVSEISFARENEDTPDEIIVVNYDTKEGLKARGIIEETPQKPNPFPKTSNIKKGFAAPPPPEGNVRDGKW